MPEAVSIRFRGQDDVTAVTNKIKAELGSLDKAAGGFSKALTGGLAGLGAGLGLAGVTMVAQQIGELAQQAGQVQILRASFEDLATGVGASSAQMMTAMRAASGGMISDANLMQSANKAMLLGVADTADELSSLLQVARVRGAAMGLSVTQAFNDIVTGLGRESALILDNLGITIDLAGVMDAYAASLGTTADKLDATQRKQALLNEVMRQSATMDVTSVENAATAWERAAAAIDNAKVALGELFGPVVAQIASGISSVATSLTDSLDNEGIAAAKERWADYSAAISEARDRLAELETTQRQIADVEPAFLRPDLQVIDPRDLDAQLTSLKLQIAALEQQAGAARDSYFALQGLTEITVQTRAETTLLASAAWTATNAWILEGAATRAKAYADAQAAAAAEVHANAVAILEAASGRTTSAVDGLKNRIMAGVGVSYSAAQAMLFLAQATGIAAEAANRLNVYTALFGAEEGAVRAAEWVNSQVAGIDTTIKKYEDLGKAGAAAAKQIDQEFENLKGKVASVLQGLLSPEGVSITQPEGAPRPDAINENARRVAAIANEGIGNQTWMEEFKNEVPGIFEEIVAAADPRAAAAQIYSEFQAGLRPELIDKEAAKARVREMILGEQSMAALATEIATELAQEMGISLSEAQAATATALGVKPGALAEDKAGDGAAQSGQATKFVSAWVLDMNSQYARIYATGVTSGEQWGQGFLSAVQPGVPTELVALLVTLITPEVLARIRKQASQSGAIP